MDWLSIIHFNTNPIKCLHESGMSYNSIGIEISIQIEIWRRSHANTNRNSCIPEWDSATVFLIKDNMATFLFLKMTFCKISSFICTYFSVLARKEPKRKLLLWYLHHSPSWNWNFPRKFQSSNHFPCKHGLTWHFDPNWKSIRIHVNSTYKLVFCVSRHYKKDLLKIK
jgi:hypothetical protein